MATFLTWTKSINQQQQQQQKVFVTCDHLNPDAGT